MKCRNARRMMDDLLDGDLRESQREELTAHLTNCASCRKELQAMERIKALAAEALEADPARERLEAISASVSAHIQAEEERGFAFRPFHVRASLAAVIFVAGLGGGVFLGATRFPKIVTERIEVPVARKEVVRVDVPVVEERIVTRYLRAKTGRPKPVLEHEGRGSAVAEPTEGLESHRPTGGHALVAWEGKARPAPQDLPLPGSGGHEAMVSVRDYSGAEAFAPRPPWESGAAERDLLARLPALQGRAQPEPTHSRTDANAVEGQSSEWGLPYSPERLARLHGRVWEGAKGT